MYDEIERLRTEYEKDSNNQKKRQQYLAAIVSRGDRAKDLLFFTSELLRSEERSTLKKMLDNDDAYKAQLDYQATVRLYNYINTIVNIASMKKKKEEGSNTDE